MLDEQKQIFIENASFIENWKTLSKNDLANMYVQNEYTNLGESAFSALLLKFWNLIPHFYYKRGVVNISPEDCYDWVVEGISKALHQRTWLNENSNLYQDAKGPEKAIMVCIMSIRANFYQAINYDKRILSYNSLSLSSLEEDASDGYFLKYSDNYSFLSDYVNSLIKDLYVKHEYVSALFIFALFNGYIKDKHLRITFSYISTKYILKVLQTVDDNFLKLFTQLVHDNDVSVSQKIEQLKNQPTYLLQYDVSKLITTLSKDEYLYELLKDETND